PTLAPKSVENSSRPPPNFNAHYNPPQAMRIRPDPRATAKEYVIAAISRQAGQQPNRAAGQRHTMRPPAFHALTGDRPHRGRRVDFGPTHPEQLTGARRG